MAEVANVPAPDVEPFPGAKHFSHATVQNGDVLSTPHGVESEYKIKEQWHSQPQHLRVIHVGAGAAGLLTAYKMKKNFQDYSLVCYEK